MYYFPYLISGKGNSIYKCFFVLKLDEAAAKARQDGKISKKLLPVTSSKFVLIPEQFL